LAACLELLPSEYWASNESREPLRQFWASVLEHQATEAFGVFSHHASGGVDPISFGLSFFATPDFKDWLLKSGHSGAADEAVRRWQAGNCPFLNHDEVRKANGGAGLDLVTLWYGYRLLDHEANYAVQRHAETFIQSYAGYRIREVIALAYTKENRRILGNLGLQLRRNLTCPLTGPGSASMLGLTTAEFPHQLGSLAAGFMRYTPPRLFLSDAEQILLRTALDGQRDQELCHILGVSIAAIKKRWLSIYAKSVPILGEASLEEEHSERRGPEKKRRILAYVRLHPEELRPVKRRRGKWASTL